MYYLITEFKKEEEKSLLETRHKIIIADNFEEATKKLKKYLDSLSSIFEYSIILDSKNELQYSINNSKETNIKFSTTGFIQNQTLHIIS